MPNPLTLYVPIKQDAESQAAAKSIYEKFATDAHDGLDASDILHYARIVLIPNAQGADGAQALMLVTTFDGAMNPYLDYFWNKDIYIKGAFQAIMDIALDPPNPPVTDLNGFQNFVNDNNLSKPDDLYKGYPQTVDQIRKRFSS